MLRSAHHGIQCNSVCIGLVERGGAFRIVALRVSEGRKSSHKCIHRVRSWHANWPVKLQWGRPPNTVILAGGPSDAVVFFALWTSRRMPLGPEIRKGR